MATEITESQNLTLGSMVASVDGDEYHNGAEATRVDTSDSGWVWLTVTWGKRTPNDIGVSKTYRLTLTEQVIVFTVESAS